MKFEMLIQIQIFFSRKIKLELSFKHQLYFSGKKYFLNFKQNSLKEHKKRKNRKKEHKKFYCDNYQELFNITAQVYS